MPIVKQTVLVKSLVGISAGAAGVIVFRSSIVRSVCLGVGLGFGLGYSWHQNSSFLSASKQKICIHSPLNEDPGTGALRNAVEQISARGFSLIPISLRLQ